MDLKHGTNRGWLRGCRKRCCRNARNRWTRTRGALYGVGLRGSVQPAVEHIRFLQRKHGATIRQISRVSGVPRTTLDYWLNHRTVAADTGSIDKVLATEPSKLDVHGTVLAGSQRRLRAMAVRGFGLTWVSERTGIHVPSLSRIRRGDLRGSILYETHEKIKEAFHTSLLLPEPQGREFSIVRARARNHGYLPAGVWEDIDDPECVPEDLDADYPDASLQDGVNRARSLAARGFTLAEVADSCEIPRPNLYKIVHGTKRNVLPETTKKLHQGCDNLDMLPDPTGGHADRARKIAKRNGWK